MGIVIDAFSHILPKSFAEDLILAHPTDELKEAAELGEISAQTLINYRNHGIVFSTQNGRGQLFSAKDIKWLRCLRKRIHVNTNYIVRHAATQEKI